VGEHAVLVAGNASVQQTPLGDLRNEAQTLRAFPSNGENLNAFETPFG